MAAADDDFDDLMDDIDFDMGSSPKKPQPGNVVFGTGLDTAKGIRDALNPMGKIPEIVRELMPNAVRSEYSDLESALSEIKDEMDKGIGEVKDSLKDVSRAVADLFPEGSIKNKLKEFGHKEGSDTGGKTKEEEEREKINQAILEALGEASDEEKQRALIQEAVAEKREESSQLMLKHIYAELKVGNNFNTRMTEKYYTKSLELQYKQLYKTAELVEITKTGWEANRKQIESILINTSLPDIIKLKTLQAANDPRLRERSKRSFLGTYFKRFNPFENLKNNVIKNIRQQVSETKQAFEMALMGADAAKMAKEMMGEDMGMTPGMIIGNWIGEKIRGTALGNLGDRIGQTKQGKRAIWNMKNFMADPKDFLRSMAENANDKTFLGKLQKMGGNYLSRLAGSPDKKRTEFVNENLDDAKAFDGRVHQAIVKVIPSLLTDIRSTLKVGLKVKEEDIAANRIYFDNKTGRFMSGNELKGAMQKDLSRAVNKDGFRMYAETFFNLLSNASPETQFDKSEKQDIVKGIARFMMRNGGSIAPNAIRGKDFLNQMGKAKEKMSIAVSHLLMNANGDYWLFDDIKNSLEGMRSNLPNMNNRLQDLHKSGYMHLAGDLVNQDEATGNWRTNDEKIDNRIVNTVGSIDFDSYDQLEGASSRLSSVDGARAKLMAGRQALKDGWNRLTQTETGGKIANFGRRLGNTRIANRIKRGISSIDNRLGVTSKLAAASSAMGRAQDNLVAFLDQDTEAIKEQFAAGRVKIESLFTVDNLKNYSDSTKKKIKSKFADTQKQVSNTLKDIHKKAKDLKKEDVKNMASNAKEKALAYYKEAEVEIAKVSKDFVDDCRDFGVTEERIEEFKFKVEKIKKDTETAVKNDPMVQAGVKHAKAGGNYVANTTGGKLAIAGGNFLKNKFMQSKLGQKVSSWKTGAKNKVTGFFGGFFGGAKANAEDGSGEVSSGKEVNEENADLMAGGKRAERQKMKEKLEEERSGSAKNLNKQRKALADQDKGRKRSGFTTLAGAKVIAAGGLGLLAISLLKKLGFGMEDFINLGKGIFSGISTVAGVLADGIKTIGSVLGWIGGGIKKIGSFFGFDMGAPDDPNQAGGSGGGMNLLGKALGIGGLYVGGRAMLRMLPGGKFLSNFFLPSPMKLISPGAFRGVKTVAKAGLAVGKFATKAALKAPGIALATARMGLSLAVPGMSPVNAAKNLVNTIKAPTPGSNLFQRIITWIKDGIGWAGKPIVALLEKGKEKVIKILDKVQSAWNAAKNKLKFMKKILSKPKVMKKIGIQAAKKLAVRLGALAAAATGIGAIISVGFLVWDVAWILKYMVFDGMTLWGAISKQMLGVDVFDPEEQKELEIDEESLAKEEEQKIIEEDSKKDEAAMKADIKEKNTGSNLPSPSSFKYGEQINPYASNMSATTTLDQYTAKQFRSPVVSNYQPPKNFVYNGIGSVSAWFESRSRPGTISSGRGDFGGVSYGTYQFIGSTLKDYLKTSKYKNEFNGLNIYTPEFNAKWAEIAARDPEGFQKDQDEYIKKSHYMPCVRKLQSIGLYVEGRSDALKAAIFSTAVSMGPGTAFSVINNALKSYGISPISATDEEIINAIYDYKAAKIDQHYKSSSYNVREGRRKRAIQEKGMVLSILNSQPGSNQPPSTSSSSIDTSTGKSSAPEEKTANSYTYGSELGPIQKASYETSKQGNTTTTTISTSTNTGVGNMVILLKQQLDVQKQMNENLAKIVANTAIFGEYAKNMSSNANQPTQMPQPVINLERKENFSNI